jgi:hypothetical protein
LRKQPLAARIYLLYLVRLQFAGQFQESTELLTGNQQLLFIETYLWERKHLVELKAIILQS